MYPFYEFSSMYLSASFKDDTIYETSFNPFETDVNKQYCWRKIARVRCEACEKHMYKDDYNHRVGMYPCHGGKTTNKPQPPAASTTQKPDQAVVVP